MADEGCETDGRAVRHIVIVGGGAAGWITAGILAARHRPKAEGGLAITLVESPDVKIIGVGEGTWPTMRSTLQKMGISETDFIRACDASFKQGAKFAKWVDGSDGDYYYHPLMLPQGFLRLDLAPYWHGHADRISFSKAVCFQEHICERGLAPKLITTAEYDSVANYAYHLNAGKFADFLQKHCTEKLGVRHVVDNVTAVLPASNGDIAGLETERSGTLTGDLFIDCTGFASLLLGRHYDVPFIDRSDVLFIDNALAMQVPYDDENANIASHTISTAQQAGWIWDIGLASRRGIGHVYSSRHTSEDEAEHDLRAYIGAAAKDLPVRKIPIRSGHRQRFWQNNCVAVGMSAGFLEPLEASALVLIELSAAMISEQLPTRRDVMDVVASRFNETFRYRWDRIIDFLKLHYILSRRTDNLFWSDNRDPATIPDSLKDLMKLWRHRSPGNMDFTSNNEVFPAASYQYVLYGMGFRSDFSDSRYRLTEGDLAEELFGRNQQAARLALANLPTNRNLIRKTYEHGFQPI